jgi:hypothetical protein
MQEDIEEPFEFFGLDKNCCEADVLRAWRRLARQYHSDKTGASDATVMHEINSAKEQCLELIEHREHALSEREFAQHICRVLDRKLKRDGITSINLEHGGGARIVGCKLREFYWLHTVDAMEWILRCSMGDPRENTVSSSRGPIDVGILSP